MIGLFDSLKVRSGLVAPARIAVGNQLELNDFNRLSSRFSSFSFVKCCRKFAPVKSASSKALPLRDNVLTLGIFSKVAAGIDVIPDRSSFKVSIS